MRTRAAALTLLLLTMPSLAMMPPYVYEDARNAAANVVVFKVDGVVPPDANMGLCEVSATIVKVERGTLYRRGDKAVIAIDCLDHWDENVPVGGTIWQDTRQLGLSRYGRAYLDAEGAVALDQYEQLASPSQKSGL